MSAVGTIDTVAMNNDTVTGESHHTRGGECVTACP